MNESKEKQISDLIERLMMQVAPAINDYIAKQTVISADDFKWVLTCNTASGLALSSNVKDITEVFEMLTRAVSRVVNDDITGELYRKFVKENSLEHKLESNAPKTKKPQGDLH